MSDMGEMFNDLRAMKQQKRADNRKSSAEILTNNGIAFDSKNNGAHLIVKTEDGYIDFWPGTGLWTNRRNNKTRRGVFNLVRYIEELTRGHMLGLDGRQ